MGTNIKDAMTRCEQEVSARHSAGIAASSSPFDPQTTGREGDEQ